MKKFLILFLGLVVAFSLCVPAFASDGEGSEGDSSTSDTQVVTQVVVPDVYITNEIDTTEDLGEYVGTSVYALNPVSPSDTSGLKSVLLGLLGDWDSIVVEHEYESSSGYTNYVREIQLDYPWLCSAAILAIFIFCLFRLGGAILCKK